MDRADFENSLRPGAYSQAGFLGPEESLHAVRTEDAATVKALGVSHATLAAGLRRILEGTLLSRSGRSLEDDRFNLHDLAAGSLEVRPGDWPPDDIGEMFGDYQVLVTSWLGSQECPWGCTADRSGDDETDGSLPWTHFASLDFLILDHGSGAWVSGPGLAVHLIEAHEFFEGRDTPYRVDPTRLAKVLRL